MKTGAIVFGVGAALAIVSVTAFFVVGPGLGETPRRVIRFCDLPGSVCSPLPDPRPADLAEIILCCDYYSGDCSLAEALSDCHPELEYVLVCDWGRTLVSGEIECYD